MSVEDDSRATQVLQGEGGGVIDNAIGGNDILTANLTVGDDSSRIRQILRGEGGSMDENTVGGDDILTANLTVGDNNNISQELYGDAFVMRGNAEGGDDTLTANTILGNNSSVVPTLYGDGRFLLDNTIGGNDTLISGLGDQTMYGDAETIDPTATTGEDTFVFDVSILFGNDIIGDFEDDKDQLNFVNVMDTSANGPDFADLDAIATATDLGDDVVIEVGTNSATINGAGLLGDGVIADLAELNTLIDIQVNGVDV